MHGPEHHLLLTAALLTAYCNTKDRDDLAVLLEEANKRSIQVPGGACGFWGICGAAIAAGIFLSIVTEASPFTEDTWGMSGQLTAKSGATIAALGGPRCCKRDTFLSLKEAIKFSNDYLQTDFGIQDITCYFFQNNKECKRRKCPYFPVKDGPEISIVGFAQ